MGGNIHFGFGTGAGADTHNKGREEIVNKSSFNLLLLFGLTVQT